MPGSVRRHNLQRLRAELNVTQETLAGWIGRSTAAIKAVEIGKLALSDNLATLIASVTGADKEWLLRNDLSESMPPLVRLSANYSPQDRAYDVSIGVLQHLFERLFAAAVRLKPSQARKTLALFIKWWLEILERDEHQPDCEYGALLNVESFEFLKAHPGLFDPDLVSLFNIDFLLKDAYLAERRRKDYDRKVMKEGKEATQWLKEHFDELSPEEQENLKHLRPGRPKSPRQSPASPAPSDRHSSRRSSANRRAAAR
jgi:DNA-binding XRE family transcriptional regulator